MRTKLMMRTRKLRGWMWAVLVLLPLSPAVAQPVLFVNWQANGQNNGASWEDAYNDLQDAIAHAKRAPGEVTEIWVAKGTYAPTGPNGDREIAFGLVEGVGIYGGFAGDENMREQRDPAQNVTILSGDLNGDDEKGGSNRENSYHVAFADWVDASAILDGFTITAGNANGGGGGRNRGGGLYNFIGSPTLVDCRFTGNSAFAGGAVYNAGGDPSWRDCLFITNYATAGGGFFSEGGSPSLTGCGFQQNVAASGGGFRNDEGNPTLGDCRFIDHLAGSGGGMDNVRGDPILTDCTFSGNTAVGAANGIGGGMRNLEASPVLTRCRFENNRSNSGLFPGAGGGIHNSAGSPVLSECVFEKNWAQHGGGAYNLSRASPSFEGCVFNENTAEYGAAIYNFDQSAPALTACRFEQNSAEGAGGALYNTGGAGGAVTRCQFTRNSANSGGAISNQPATVSTISFCSFVANSADGVGGAIRNRGAAPMIVNCGFFGNTASAGGAVQNAGTADAEFINCLFSGNRASFKGGAVRNTSSSPVITHCTLSRNVSVDTGGGISSDGGEPTVANSILWQNADSSGFGPTSQIDGSASVRYSCVLGGYSGEGNIEDDPLFVDPNGPDNIFGTPDDDLRQTLDSPTIDAADNAAVPPDVADLDGDEDTKEPTPFDLASHPRFYDIPGVPDTGNGERPMVDMGAYEHYDCNENGYPDDEDIREGRSEDCNENWIPDECELEGNDCNENLIPDDCELEGNDCNGNGVPDDCDIAEGKSQDCNENRIPDECELDGNDCNENRIPDECELKEHDCNHNGVPDDCDIMERTSPDCNGNWVPDECDLAGGHSNDCNNNGVPDECEVVMLYAGTRGLQSGDGKVFGYLRNGEWIDMASSGLGDASTVMDLVFYDSRLYAGVTPGPPGCDECEGQVWRWEGQAWNQVGTLEKGVMVLAVMNGHLYAATAPPALYRCAECDGGDWEQLPSSIEQNYFRSGIVTTVCGQPELYLGDGFKDIIYQYQPGGHVREINNFSGSCIWDFAEYDGDIYAGAFAGERTYGNVYRMRGSDCGARFSRAFVTGANNWALEPFRKDLYIGSGAPVPGAQGAQLWTSRGGSPTLIHAWPTTQEKEGVASLAAAGEDGLYIGLGAPYHVGLGDGRAEVWRYDGDSFIRISDEDAFGAAVQTLLLAPPEVDCNRNGRPDDCDIDQGYSQDVNGNRVPDECETPPCKDVRKLKAKCKRSKLRLIVKVRGGAHDGKSVTVRVNDRQHELVIRRGKAALILKKRKGEQRVVLLRPPNCVDPRTLRCK